MTARAYRLDKIITDRLKRGEKFNMDVMKEMQLDVRDEFVAEVLPPLLGRLGEFRQIWSSPRTEPLYEKLTKWDFELGKDSVEAAIYHVWEYLFQHSLFSLSGLSE